MYGRKKVLFLCLVFSGILAHPLSPDMHARANAELPADADDLSGQLDWDDPQIETIVIGAGTEIQIQPEESAEEAGAAGNIADEDAAASDTAETADGNVAEAPQEEICQKVMYLTFDDGPSKENTEAILDILKDRGIKATFFLIGENVERYPEVAKRIADEGHTIGIHCYSHEYKKIYASVESYVEDFEKAKQVVYETTGVETKLFRFPGGSINSHNKNVYKDIIQEMTDKGYIYFDWNASLEDATKHNEPQRLLENASSSTLNRKKVVMLAHDRIHNTALCLEDLIDQFPEYQMLPLTEDVKPVQF